MWVSQVWSTSGSRSLFWGYFLMVAEASHCHKVKVIAEQMRNDSSSLLIKLTACSAPGLWGCTSCPMTQTGRLGSPAPSFCAWTHWFFWGVPWYTYATCLEKTCSDSAPLVFWQSWHSACDGESRTFFAVLRSCVSVYTFACRVCERLEDTVIVCLTDLSNWNALCDLVSCFSHSFGRGWDFISGVFSKGNFCRMELPRELSLRFHGK